MKNIYIVFFVSMIILVISLLLLINSRPVVSPIIMAETAHADIQPTTTPIQKLATTTPVKMSSPTFRAHVTAYTGVESCHYEGCITASGKRAYVGGVACPRKYKLGTRVRINSIEYTCEDRTALRYDGRFDIFFGFTQEAHKNALRFGIQNLSIEVIK